MWKVYTILLVRYLIRVNTRHVDIESTIERIIFTSAVLIGKYHIIGYWLAFKVIGRWSTSISKIIEKEREYMKGLNRHIYFIGVGLLILYGVVGGKIIQWLQCGDWLNLSTSNHHLPLPPSHITHQNISQASRWFPLSHSLLHRPGDILALLFRRPAYRR